VSDDDSPDRRPIGDVLPGMELHPLDAGWTALEAFVVVKCLDDNGHTTWAYRTTNRLNREELLGALVVHTELLRRELVEEWEGD